MYRNLNASAWRCALPAHNTKELSDDNLDNQERRKVFADAAHTGAGSARNVTSTGVSPGRTEEEKLGSDFELSVWLGLL